MVWGCVCLCVYTDIAWNELISAKVVHTSSLFCPYTHTHTHTHIHTHTHTHTHTLSLSYHLGIKVDAATSRCMAAIIWQGSSFSWTSYNVCNTHKLMAITHRPHQLWSAAWHTETDTTYPLAGSAMMERGRFTPLRSSVLLLVPFSSDT